MRKNYKNRYIDNRMPYKSEKIRIQGTNLDRRVKLTENDKQDIRDAFAKGESIRSITRRYKVSRRLIQFTIFPERMELNKELRKKRGGWKQYYDKDRHREDMKGTRAYKQKLYVEKKIK